MGHDTQTDRNQTNTVEQAILLAVKGLRYGSVEIVIHDSKVVQIERKEKMRFGGDVLKHQ
jgi:hypothetical protein